MGRLMGVSVTTKAIIEVAIVAMAHCQVIQTTTTNIESVRLSVDFSARYNMPIVNLFFISTFVCSLQL